jgi:hypothetical protein
MQAGSNCHPGHAWVKSLNPLIQPFVCHAKVGASEKTPTLRNMRVPKVACRSPFACVERSC